MPNATQFVKGMGMPRHRWGGPPGPRGTPPSRCRNDDIGISQGADRPAGASAAENYVALGADA